MPKRLGVSLAKDPARNKEDFPIVDNPCPHAAMSHLKRCPVRSVSDCRCLSPAEKYIGSIEAAVGSRGSGRGMHEQSVHPEVALLADLKRCRGTEETTPVVSHLVADNEVSCRLVGTKGIHSDRRYGPWDAEKRRPYWSSASEDERRMVVAKDQVAHSPRS